MNSDVPTREFTIPYPISDVKSAIVRTSGILRLITQELQGTFDSQEELNRNSGCLGFAVIIIVSSLMANLLF